MNIQTSNNKPQKQAKPTSFVEATVGLAKCYKNALAAGVEGDDELVRFWVDASRSVKSYFKRYQEETDKEKLVSGLKKNGSKELLAESIQTIKQAEPFVAAWAGRFRSLSVREFTDFHPVHWNIFLD